MTKNIANISFYAVCVIGLIAIIFSFSNYTVSLNATRITIDNVKEMLPIENINKDQNKATVDSVLVSNISEINRVLDKVESSKDKSFSSNTLSFLFTIFSILFVTVGMFLYTRTEERLKEIKNNLRLQQWTSVSNSFSHYIISLNNCTILSPNNDISDIIADSRLYLKMINETIQKIKSQKIGISESQIKFCFQLLDTLNNRYESIKKQMTNNDFVTNELEDFQDKLIKIQITLISKKFVKRWNDNINIQN